MHWLRFQIMNAGVKLVIEGIKFLHEGVNGQIIALPDFPYDEHEDDEEEPKHKGEYNDGDLNHKD